MGLQLQTGRVGHLCLQPHALPVRLQASEMVSLELPYDQALGMIRTGQICDGKTIMLLYWAAIHGPFGGSGSELTRADYRSPMASSPATNVRSSSSSIE